MLQAETAREVERIKGCVHMLHYWRVLLLQGCARLPQTRLYFLYLRFVLYAQQGFLQALYLPLRTRAWIASCLPPLLSHTGTHSPAKASRRVKRQR